MGGVRKKTLNDSATEKSLVGGQVSRSQRALTGSSVKEARTANISGVEKAGGSSAKPRKEKPAAKRGEGAGQTMPTSARARMLAAFEAASAAKSAMSDADEGSEPDETAQSPSVRAYRMARKRFERKKTEAEAEAKNPGGPEGGEAAEKASGKRARASGKRKSERGEPATSAEAGAKTAQAPTASGSTQPTGQAQKAARGATARKAASAEAAEQVQEKRYLENAIAAARQAAEKAAGLFGKAMAAIAGTPVGVVVAVIVAIIASMAVIAAVLGSIVGAAEEEIGLEGLSEVESAVAVKLKEMGWNNAQIAAAMGNIYCESGFSLTSQEAGGGGMGLMQWTTADSHEKLRSIAAKHKKPWTDLDVQIEMMEYWIGSVFQGSVSYFITDSRSDDPPAGTKVSGSRAAFDKSSDVTACTKHFCYVAERPGIPHETNRVKKAKEYLAILNNPTNSGKGAGKSLAGGKLGDPLTGTSYIISSPFGYRPFDNSHHNGLDMAAPSGTHYYAAESGTVLYATNDGGYNGGNGNWVVIDHGGGLVTKYIHSSRVYVRPGQKVKKGEHIGNVGNTGASTGAHLHFQVEVGGVPVDPAPYIGR